MQQDIKQSRNNRGQLATEQQRKASDPKKSVWVQASAGTGKTKVLSDRVLRILLNGGHPGRILCLTYTKAAAVEMNQRISKKLSSWAVMEEDKLNKELQNLLGNLPTEPDKLDKLQATARQLFAILLDTPGGMKIQTLHSFCQEILKKFPLEANISPYFEVMDDRATKEALDNIRQKISFKAEKNPQTKLAQSLAYLSGQISEFSFPKILTSITENRNKINQLFEKYSTPEAIITEISKKLDIKSTTTENDVLQDFAQNTDFTKLKTIADAWNHGTNGNKEKAQTIYSILETKDIINNLDRYKYCFFSRSSNEASKGHYMAGKGAIDYCSDILELCAQEVERFNCLDNKIKAINLLKSTKAVLYLAQELIIGYSEFKNLHSKLDYEDLIILTHKLLSGPQVPQWVMFKLDGGIDNILIDEAQDTSPAQWGIIKSLCSEFFTDIGTNQKQKTIFAVGDKKQSIYSFQGADPKEFEATKQYFAQTINSQELFDEINLEVSFRSTSAVLDTVNSVFSTPEVKQGVSNANEDITHIPFRIGDAGKIELWPLTSPLEEEVSTEWHEPIQTTNIESSASRLAREIAQKIYNLVENKTILLSQNRPLRYKDFMILVQRRNYFVEEIVRACKNVGVSVAGIDKIKLSEQLAIQDLISLGRFLLLPSDDLSLAEILKSPLFGLNDDDLITLCCDRKSKTLWSSLGENSKYKAIYQTLKELCILSENLRPFELYSYVLNKLHGRKKFIARLGFEAEDGLDEFINLTLSFEQEHIPDLQGFINWMLNDDVEIKRELEQSEIDNVRIMTVHGSKGLQAPVVILPDMVRVPQTKKEAAMLWDELFYYPLSANEYHDICKKIKQNEKISTLEEYRRLLYVALTRAEDKLILCGYYNHPKSKPTDDSWYNICQNTLKKIGQEQKEGLITHTSQQLIEPENKQETQTSNQIEMPDFSWLYTPAIEEDNLAKPLSPSKLEEDDEPAIVSPISGSKNNRYRRGLIIHKLLQFLPETTSNNKTNLILEFLTRNAPELSETQQKRICQEVLNLIENPQFSPLFSAQSQAEVPIMGKVGNKIISGQIDRLVVLDNEVMIVDYKTNRPAAQNIQDVPSAYIKQLRAYQDLLKQIYPNKKISSHILWTDTANLMKIE